MREKSYLIIKSIRTRINTLTIVVMSQLRRVIEKRSHLTEYNKIRFRKELKRISCSFFKETEEKKNVKSINGREEREGEKCKGRKKSRNVIVIKWS